MKILLADRQDITRAGLSYVIEKMEGLESKYVEDKAELMLALKENEDTVVILDYTNFDINDAAELLILNQRFPYTRWLLFSEDLSTDFVKVLVASSSMFSILLKESPLMEIKEAIRFCAASNRFICQRMMEVLLAPGKEGRKDMRGLRRNGAFLPCRQNHHDGKSSTPERIGDYPYQGRGTKAVRSRP